jgi:hypothetical protein
MILRIGALFLAGLSLAAAAPPAQPDDAPLSPTQILLFDTPHLKAIDHPVPLEYNFHRNGRAAFDDLVVERINEVHPEQDVCVRAGGCGSRHVAGYVL